MPRNVPTMKDDANVVVMATSQVQCTACRTERLRAARAEDAFCRKAKDINCGQTQYCMSRGWRRHTACLLGAIWLTNGYMDMHSRPCGC